MRCEEARERFSAYLDGELDAETLEGLGGHLARCANCASDLRIMKALDEELQSLPTIDPGRDFARRVTSRLDTWDFFTGPPLESRPIVSTLTDLLGELLDMIGIKRETTTRTLEEFGDCPPLSMGSVYFRIIGESGRV